MTNSLYNFCRIVLLGLFMAQMATSNWSASDYLWQAELEKSGTRLDQSVQTEDDSDDPQLGLVALENPSATDRVAEIRHLNSGDALLIAESWKRPLSTGPPPT